MSLSNLTDTGTGTVDEPRSSSPARSPSPARSEGKSVKFNLEPQGPTRSREPSREPSRKRESEQDPEPEREPEQEPNDDDEHTHRRHRRRKDDERSNSTRESGRDRKRHRRDESPASDASDATIDLPPRFDERGRKRPEDPLADKLESLLQNFLR
jgi:hypothetical protein